jgi:hypothetical protein
MQMHKKYRLTSHWYSCIGKGRRGRDRMVVGFSTTVQSVPITTNVVSSNPVHGRVYSIQHYVIKFVNDLRQVGGFIQVFQSSSLSIYKAIVLRDQQAFPWDKK